MMDLLTKALFISNSLPPGAAPYAPQRDLYRQPYGLAFIPLPHSPHHSYRIANWAKVKCEVQQDGCRKSSVTYLGM